MAEVVTLVSGSMRVGRHARPQRPRAFSLKTLASSVAGSSAVQPKPGQCQRVPGQAQRPQNVGGKPGQSRTTGASRRW